MSGGAHQRRAPVDASMTLLNEVMQRPLDPGYAAAAARRAQDPQPHRERRRVPTTTLLAAVAGAVLVVSVSHLRVSVDVESRAVLLDEVGARTGEVEGLERRVAALQAEIDAIGRSAVSGAGETVVERAEMLARTTGAAPVVGPGIRVVLDDAGEGRDLGSDPRDPGQDDQGRVQDRDLQAVVNGLWAAGAEAVAVNGQRLTAMSSIREAGPAVLVNFRPLTPPYEVEAIGDPEQLQVDFASSVAGRYLASLENYGIATSVGGADRLQLPGAPGLQLRHAQPADASPAGGTMTEDGTASAEDGS